MITPTEIIEHYSCKDYSQVEHMMNAFMNESLVDRMGSKYMVVDNSMSFDMTFGHPMLYYTFTLKRG